MGEKEKAGLLLCFFYWGVDGGQDSPIRPVPKCHAIKTFLKKRKWPKDQGKSLRDRGGRLCYILGVIGNFLLIFFGIYTADGCF